MNKKKIIGYKLIKPKYANAAKEIMDIETIGDVYEYINNYKFNINGEFIRRLKDAGVLDLWFEPIYEQYYQVGDYITCIKNRFNESSHPDFNIKGRFAASESTTQKIVKVEKFKEELVAVGHLGGVARIGQYPNSFRKATQEEIESLNEITVFINNQFDLKLTKKGIFHKTDNITEFVKELIEHYSRLKFGNYSLVPIITFEITGCESKPTSLEDWKSVYNKYLELCS